MERTAHVQTAEAAPAQDAAAPAQDSAQTRFVSTGDKPAVGSEPREQGPSASDRAFEAHKGTQTLKRHDMQWSDDIGQNAVKDAFWKARWNGETDHLAAAQQEIVRRAEAAPEDAGLKGHGDFWAHELGSLLWNVKKLHDNAKGGSRSYVDVHAFRLSLAAFPAKQLLWPDEKALILDGFETLVAQGAAKWNKPVGLAERTSGDDGAQDTAPAVDASNPLAERKTEVPEAKGPLAERIKHLLEKRADATEFVKGLKELDEAAGGPAQLVLAIKQAGLTAELAGKVGDYMLRGVKLVARGDFKDAMEYVEAAKILGGVVGGFFAVPAAIEDTRKLLYGVDMEGGPVGPMERAKAGVSLIKDYGAMAEGVKIIAEQGMIKLGPEALASLGTFAEAANIAGLLGTYYYQGWKLALEGGVDVLNSGQVAARRQFWEDDSSAMLAQIKDTHIDPNNPAACHTFVLHMFNRYFKGDAEAHWMQGNGLGHLANDLSSAFHYLEAYQQEHGGQWPDDTWPMWGRCAIEVRDRAELFITAENDRIHNKIIAGL